MNILVGPTKEVRQRRSLINFEMENKVTNLESRQLR